MISHSIYMLDVKGLHSGGSADILLLRRVRENDHD